MIETFSPEMCQKLSSFAPGFEGHWYWYSEFEHAVGYGKKKLYGEPWVMCEEAERGGNSIGEYTGTRICPAWQAEDVITNLFKIEENLNEDAAPFFCHEVADKIAGILLYSTNLETAYQKIEEYLWEILK